MALPIVTLRIACLFFDEILGFVKIFCIRVLTTTLLQIFQWWWGLLTMIATGKMAIHHYHYLLHYHTIGKPVHMPLSVVHWSLLSLLCVRVSFLLTGMTLFEQTQPSRMRKSCIYRISFKKMTQNTVFNIYLILLQTLIASN